MILADGCDLQLRVEELHQALIVEVRGVLDGDEGDPKDVTLLNRIIRYGQTIMVGHSGRRSDGCVNHHGNATSDTFQRHRNAVFTRLEEKHG